MRVLKKCPECGELIPTSNERFCFHLAHNSRFRICPGSENSVLNIAEPSVCFYFVPNTESKSEPIKPEPPRPRICLPCKQNDHLLCEDNCDCECADTFDMPRSLQSAGYKLRPPGHLFRG